MAEAKNVLNRFAEKVKRVESGCHEWQSTLHRDGYGKFWLDGRQVASHRAAYLLYVGEIPEGSMVLHTCDNRPCVNPGHLYLGDGKRNAQDRTERARWTHERISTAEVEEIRGRYIHGGETQTALAEEFNCHQTQISRIVRRTQRTIK